jgi:hypothetical protein
MQALFFPDSSWEPKMINMLPADKVFCQNMYSHFRTEKKLSVELSEKYAMMMGMKKMYPELHYEKRDELNMKKLFAR